MLIYISPGVSIGGYANGFRGTTSQWLEREATHNNDNEAQANMLDCMEEVTVAQEYDAEGYVLLTEYSLNVY
jgi:hypothetical protein